MTPFSAVYALAKLHPQDQLASVRPQVESGAQKIVLVMCRYRPESMMESVLKSVRIVYSGPLDALVSRRRK